MRVDLTVTPTGDGSYRISGQLAEEEATAAVGGLDAASFLAAIDAEELQRAVLNASDMGSDIFAGALAILGKWARGERT